LDREMVLKWEIRVAATTTPFEIKQIHCDVMTAMYDQFQGELEFLTTNNTVMNRDQVSKHVDHAWYFRLHPKKNRLPDCTAFEIYQRIRTCVTLSAIKQCDHVHAKIRASKVWISEHRWTQNITDVVEIGWYTCMNPAIALPTQVEELVRDDIIRAAVGIPAGRIPSFRCGFTTVKMQYNKKQYVTKAVGIQCRVGDRHNLIQLLAKTSETSTEKFIFYKARHREPANYAKAIVYQSPSGRGVIQSCSQ
jgi:hypothetical protein